MKIIPVLTIYIIILFFAPGPVHSRDLNNHKVDYADSIVKAINYLRSDPLTGYEALGLDVASILSDGHLIPSSMEDGVPRLTLDQQLNDKAREKAMSAQTGFLNNEEVCCVPGPDLKSCFTARCLTLGGSIFFENYINPERAIVILLRQIFEDESKVNMLGKTHLLDGSLRRIGVYFGEKSVEKRGRILNGYVLKVVVSSGFDFVLEAHLESMINDFRTGTKAFPGGLDQEKEAIYSEVKVKGSSGDPMAWSHDLYQSADFAADFLNTHEHAWEDMDGLRDALGESLYSAGFNSSSLDIVAGCFVLDSKDSVSKMAENIFYSFVHETNDLQGDEFSFGQQRGSEMAFKVLPIFEQDQVSVIVVGIAAVPVQGRFYLMGRISDPDLVLDHENQDPYADVTVIACGNINPRPVSSGVDILGRFQIRMRSLNVPFSIVDVEVKDEKGKFSGHKSFYTHNSNIYVVF